MAATKLSATVFAVVAVFALFQSSGAQTTHVVGDALGWTIPPNPTAYATWASRQKFALGDVLVFNYPTGAHDVAEVDKAAYDNCGTTNPISMVTTGPTRITLNSSGDHYFMCTFPGHCSTGQKLSVMVPSASATPPAAAPPTPAAMSPTPAATMPPAATPTPSTTAPTPSTPVPTTPSPSPSMATPPSPSPSGATSPSGMATPPSSMAASPSGGGGAGAPFSPTNPSTPAPSGSTPAPPSDSSASSFASVAAIPAALLSIALVLLN